MVLELRPKPGPSNSDRPKPMHGHLADGHESHQRNRRSHLQLRFNSIHKQKSRSSGRLFCLWSRIAAAQYAPTCWER